MAIFQTIVDLFNKGASAVAEMFVRGRTSSKDFGQIMKNKYGDEYNVPLPIQEDFVSRFIQAAGPAAEIQSGIVPQIESIPLWTGSPSPGEFIHRGLARISIANSAGDEQFSTHIPFNYNFKELLTYLDIQQKIRDAIGRGDAEISEFCHAEINRIEQLIRFHSITGFGTNVDMEILSVFHGVEL